MHFVHGVGGQCKFSGFKFIAFLMAPSHLHNEMQNFTATRKVSCTPLNYIYRVSYSILVFFIADLRLQYTKM
jgi:hypothetical protein